MNDTAKEYNESLRALLEFAESCEKHSVIEVATKIPRLHHNALCTEKFEIIRYLGVWRIQMAQIIDYEDCFSTDHLLKYLETLKAQGLLSQISVRLTENRFRD
jgi:hypothetical protein